MTGNSCTFCDLTDKENISSSDLLIPSGLVHVRRSTDIMLNGYLILSPVRHVFSLPELNETEMLELHRTLQQLVKMVYSLNGVKKVYVLSFGEVVPHFHYHIFPRYEWMEHLPQVYKEGQLDGLTLFNYIRTHKDIVPT